ncbi:hypothetical protein LMG6871_01875 [Ralstonia edaphis]|nr:hypothetical protein LMG6871_01875 [Ralstonia sp. LMG 6871]
MPFCRVKEEGLRPNQAKLTTVEESTEAHADNFTDLRDGSLVHLLSNRERHSLLDNTQVDHSPLNCCPQA